MQKKTGEMNSQAAVRITFGVGLGLLFLVFVTFGSARTEFSSVLWEDRLEDMDVVSSVSTVAATTPLEQDLRTFWTNIRANGKKFIAARSREGTRLSESVGMSADFGVGIKPPTLDERVFLDNSYRIMSDIQRMNIRERKLNKDAVVQDRKTKAELFKNEANQEDNLRVLGPRDRDTWSKTTQEEENRASRERLEDGRA